MARDVAAADEVVDNFLAVVGECITGSCDSWGLSFFEVVGVTIRDVVLLCFRPQHETGHVHHLHIPLSRPSNTQFILFGLWYARNLPALDTDTLHLGPDRNFPRIAVGTRKTEFEQELQQKP